MRSNTISRAIDVFGSVAGLLVTSPLIVAAALAIKASDQGPVLYKQERIGQGGKPFTIFKLRTMTVGAENKGLGLLIGMNDSRITSPGKILRASSIDELPQLLNVLRGDMSLVGPRPTVASQVERYSPEQRRRLEVKPGLTGWAQINGRNALSWPERIQLDLWYVDNKSLWLDLAILARTPRSLLSVRAVYAQDGGTTDL